MILSYSIKRLYFRHIKCFCDDLVSSSYNNNRILLGVGNENPTAFKDIDWKSMSDNSKCVAQTKEQIKLEMQASYAYLAMGAHFSKDSVNRPGFANFFFTAAGEEREHGRKLIEYMLMRGEFVKNGVPDVSEIKFNKLNNTVPANLYTEQFAATGLEALQAALKLEVKVTRSIKDLIAVCEEETKDNPNNDYHVSIANIFLIQK